MWQAGLGSARPEVLRPRAEKAKVPSRRKFIGIPLEVAPRTLDPIANIVLVTGLLPASSSSLVTAGAHDAAASPHQDDESGIEDDNVPVSSAQVVPAQPASAQELVAPLAPPSPPSPPSPARLPVTPALRRQPLPTEEQLQERPNPIPQVLDGGHLPAVDDFQKGRGRVSFPTSRSLPCTPSTECLSRPFFLLSSGSPACRRSGGRDIVYVSLRNHTACAASR
jgi:hypothetical protein